MGEGVGGGGKRAYPHLNPPLQGGEEIRHFIVVALSK